MAAHNVNLDALVTRDDFEVEADQPQPSGIKVQSLRLGELEADSITYVALRKPDFQRETSSWEPEMVVDLVRSFLDGDLIPSVIMWRSPKSGNLFVIDGAHRLSALAAWVQNDYGGGKRSVDFFEGLIPPEQITAANRCRDLIAAEIGTYAEVKAAILRPENALSQRVLRARNMAAFGMPIQWVEGDAKKAEASFFRINQKATPINPVELLMLQSRRKPNAIAARALIRAGVGHKYWSSFPDAAKKEIERVAREIYDMLFIPVLQNPIKTLDLPVAGRGYSGESVKLIFEFVNLANRINIRNQKGAAAELPEDEDGSATLRFLNNVKKQAQLVSSQHASSLGLHPAIYFYGATGRYLPSAFLALVSFLDALSQRNKLTDFTVARERSEDFLFNHPQFLNQLVREYGSSGTTITAIVDLFEGVMKGVLAKQTDDEIIESLKSEHRLRSLTLISDEERGLKKNFSAETKNRAFLRDALKTSTRCAICGARVHVNAISIDHIKAKRDGGMGTAENAQLAHPYCNSARDALEPLISAFRAPASPPQAEQSSA